MFQVLASSRFKVRMWSTKSARFISTKSTTKWWVFASVGKVRSRRAQLPLLLLAPRHSFSSSLLHPATWPQRWYQTVFAFRSSSADTASSGINFPYNWEGLVVVICIWHARTRHTRIFANDHGRATWKTKSGFSKAVRSGDHTGPTVIDNSLFVVYYQTNSCDVSQGFS